MVDNRIEKLVLSEIMNLDDVETQADSIDLLKPTHFMEDKHSLLFKDIQTLIKKKRKADLISLSEFINAKGYMALIELMELNELCISPANLQNNIKVLIERWYKNTLIQETNRFANQITKLTLYDDIAEKKEEYIATLNGLSLFEQAKLVNFAESQQELLKQANSKNALEGFCWGDADSLGRLDIITRGIIPRRLYVIGGVKKSGKTRFLINVLHSLYHQNIRTAILSLEVPAYELNKMIAGCWLDINEMRLSDRRSMTDDQYSRLQTFKICEDSLIAECKSGLTIGEVNSRIKRFAALGAKVICIDFLQRIAFKGENRANELEDMCKMIADATRTYEVAIILLSQLNVQAEKEIPQIGHLKGSGGIGEAADTIILLDNTYRRTKDHRDKNKMVLTLEQRYGEAACLQLGTDLGKSKFFEIGTPEL